MEINPFYQEIGSHIRAEREALGFTQEDLAQELGLSRPALVNIEAGRQRMLVHRLYDIAEALGVSIRCLLPERRNR